MRNERTFLSRLKMGRFGKFRERSLGPFSPRLNVLQGENEAGKSTSRALISQVLFGWDRKTAGASHYGLEGENRKGSLTFSGDSGEWELVRMEKSGNQTDVIIHAGAPWDDAFEDITAGLDKETYANVFAFDSDQLRTIESKSDVTAKLTTAQSATPVSPVEALKAIGEEIGQYTSSAQTAKRSIPVLRKRISEIKQEISSLMSQERERAEAQSDLVDLDIRISHLETKVRETSHLIESENRTIPEAESLLEQYREVSAEIEKLTADLAGIERELTTLSVDEKALSASGSVLVFQASRQDDERLLGEIEDARREVGRLDQVLERSPLGGCSCDDAAQQAVADLSARKARIEERVDQRRSELDREIAQLEGNKAALKVPTDGLADASGFNVSRSTVLVLSLALVGMVLSGVFAMTGQVGWVWAPLLPSLMLVVFVLIRGLATARTSPLATNDSERLTALTERVRESERRVSEAQSLLDAANRDRECVESEVTSLLMSLGLGDVASNLNEAAVRIKEEQQALGVRKEQSEAMAKLGTLEARWAEKSAAMRISLESLGVDASDVEPRALFVAIDEAQVRCEIAERVASEHLRLSDRAETMHASIEREQEKLKVVVGRLAALLEMPEDQIQTTAVTSTLNSLRDRLSDMRAKLDADSTEKQSLLNDKHRIIGSLKAAERDFALSEHLAELEQLQAQVAKYAEELAVLVIARHLIDQSMASWESERQPEIYRLASDLFRKLTAGRWCEVRAGDKPGEFLAVDVDREVRKPAELSTATAQQLYLALRIALLQSNPEVGADLPVVMDDPFVHFDEDRRRHAVEVVAELSKNRQVLFFTQDPETAGLVAQAASEVTSIRL